MTHLRMCEGKVRYGTDAEAWAEAVLQQAQRPHWVWSFYDCFWCDFLHIGRHAVAPGHSLACQTACSRRSVHAREPRIWENTW